MSGASSQAAGCWKPRSKTGGFQIPDSRAGHLVAVLFGKLAMVGDKHRLPMPTYARLHRLIARLTAKPADGEGLSVLMAA